MAGSNSTPSDFYVYLHKRATDGRVFYVGKGCGCRAFRTSKRNKHWLSIVKKHGYSVEIVQSGMQEWWAFELECELISYYGLKNLCNKTDGGEGVSGLVWSYESRQKMSKSVSSDGNFWFKKQQHPNTKKAALLALKNHRFSNKGIKMSEATKEKIRNAIKGKSHTEETKKKISESKRKINPINCSNGMRFLSPAFATDWLKKNKGFFAQQTHIRRCCQGRQKTAYGFEWRFDNENS